MRFRMMFHLSLATASVFAGTLKAAPARVTANSSGLPVSARKAEVMFEAPRTVAAKEGRFADWFAPFEVHVYRFQLCSL
jgi:hypothetical protein